MEAELLTYLVPADTRPGLTVGKILHERLHLSRTLVRRLKYEGQILLNGEPVYVTREVRAGDVVRLVLPEAPSYLEPEALPLAVVYEDEDLLIVDKPPGMLVHPVKAERTGTLANAIAHRWAAAGHVAPVRPLHRLDRDTSGLVAFGRNAYAHGQLVEQLENRRFKREYLALVAGRVMPDQGTVDAPIARVPDHEVKRQVAPGGQPAVTHYWVERRFAGATLLRVELETGRTHQIRVHLSHLGHPLLGDPLYGGGSFPAFPRQALHAFRISLLHPRSREPLSFVAPLPPDSEDLLTQLC